MGFSLRKSFKVGKNSKVNLSTGGGIGFSTGKKGARVSVNKNGIGFYGSKGILKFSKRISFKKLFNIIKNLK
ncbi:DUF4236 domain-containing protein [Clostridium perfringens]|uniref:DUF4236 domain-containing protein n=1 Tax=Clostridium perfringens TaxID=1502 RepID=UPI00224827B7|nr:DUF4236 domain-containing protein [Clostridium perfringens]MCX0356177.1 DUF4236 domain-containing protein [Clostridium perfringens]